MKKNCEKYQCKERAFKQVLIKDKKNKEYHWYCFDHYDEHIQKQKIECDWEECKQIGEFKAPSKDVDTFLWFCEEHIKIYNQKWDFFDGMTQTEIENFIYDDLTFHKKTQKFGNQDAFFQKLWNNAIEDELLFFNKFKNSSAYAGNKYNHTQTMALKKMELNTDVNWSDIRAQFKKLVKKYHPDINAGNKKYEEKLKEITLAYTFLNNSINKNTEVA
ncbi:MAG: DnaJ domain-containing protein [Pelagibacteraceae bacterium]